MKWGSSSTLFPDCSSDWPWWCWLTLIFCLPWVMKGRERGRLHCASGDRLMLLPFPTCRVFPAIPTIISLRHNVTFPLENLCIKQMPFLLKSVNWYSLGKLQSSMKQHLINLFSRRQNLSVILVWVYLRRPVLLFKVTGSRSLTLRGMMSWWEAQSSSVLSQATKHPFLAKASAPGTLGASSGES